MANLTLELVQLSVLLGEFGKCRLELALQAESGQVELAFQH